MNLTPVTKKEAFENLHKEWNELLNTSNNNSIFLCWEWLYTWWNQFSHSSQLYILLVRDKDHRLVGVAPFYIHREYRSLNKKKLALLGDTFVSSEYLDIFTLPGFENEVTSLIFEHFNRKHSEWNYLHFAELLPSSNIIQHFEKPENSNQYYTFSTEQRICPYLPLMPSAGQQNKTLDAKLNSIIQRKGRKLHKLGAKLSLITELSQLEIQLTDLFEFHQQSWVRKGHPGSFKATNIRNFHIEAAARLLKSGHLKLYKLHTNEHTLSLLYTFAFKGTIFYYQSGHNPDAIKNSPGTILMWNTIVEAITENMTEFDFLRGNEPYKSMWTKSHRLTQTMAYIPKNEILVLSLLHIQKTSREIKSLVKTLIQARLKRDVTPS